MNSLGRVMWSNYNGEASSLCAGVVHLWRAKLMCTEDELLACEQILSSGEIASSHRLIKKEDQCKSIFSKAILRRVLARYLAISAEKIAFSVGEKGKPFIAGGDLQFNLSHSGDYLLIAVTRENPIGVDVERVNSNKDFMAIAKRFFAPSECAAIASDVNPIDAFYRCWTRKEAFIKATGLGLSFPLHDFEVDVSENPQGDSCLLRVHDHQFSVNDWMLRPVSLVDAESSYFAAVAVRGVIERVLYFN